MSERLSDLEARIGTAHQLAAVIGAMRGIAAARSREARGRLDGIRAYARTVGSAIGDALVFLPEGVPAASARAGGARVVIALCAEQGFAGAFNEHVLDAAARLLRTAPGAGELFLLGDRGLAVAAERGLAPAWSAPMIAHAGQAAALANRIADALYGRLDRGGIEQVDLVHALPGASAAPQVAERALIPFDFERFPSAAARAVPPRLTLAPATLLARLAEEYVFAELCEALMLSFAAENEARMRAMIAARENVNDTLGTLTRRARELRQEAITSEIVELAGAAAAGPR